MTPTTGKRAAPDMYPSRERMVGWYAEGGCYVNVAGNYDYLELPYYVSQDCEAEGLPIHPTCKEMLDAYVPPLFLVKAALHGLPVPNWYVSNGYFEPPVILDPINPFMVKSRVVNKPGQEQAVAKSMTRNFTYAICCQQLPPGSDIVKVRSVMGWCGSRLYRDAVKPIWDVFRIPLAIVRLVFPPDGSILYSDISQLPLASLGKRERDHLEKAIRWQR